MQVYAASIMFGYFLRQIDKRFQLERSLGTLPLSRDDAVARLEKLFALADAESPAEGAAADSPVTSSSGRQEGEATGQSSSVNNNLPMKKEKSALRRYVEVREASGLKMQPAEYAHVNLRGLCLSGFT